MTPSISIIVAVYNAEKTLRRCLDSILSQQLRDFEVIAINDGSSDKSMEILREMAQQDARLRIFEQSNQGVATTRQKGHDLAEGKYLIHIDADDWIDSDYLKILYETAESTSADMTTCGLTFHKKDGIEEAALRPDSLSPSILAGALLRGMHGSLCNKLILRETLTDHEIRFLNGLNCWEDLYVVLRLLAIDIRVAYAETLGYHYDKTGNPDSITNNWFRIPIGDRLFFFDAIEPYIRPENKKEFAQFVSRFAYDSLYCEKQYCPDYSGTFQKYEKLIAGADIPQYKKWLVLLQIHHIPVPFRRLRALKRKIWNKK